MSRFLEALHSGRVLLMDGAMGTMLRRAGLRDGENATAWNVLHPKRVRAVHQAYRDAGAEVLLTNTFLLYCENLFDTFQAAGRFLRNHDELWEASRELTETDPPPAYRLASLGPVAGPLSGREFQRPRYFSAYSKNYQAADAVLLETCSSPRARYAVRRIRASGDKAVLLSLTYLRNDAGGLVTFSGHSPEWFAERARQYGIAALGVNCGRDIGMDEVIEIVRRYRQVTDLPLFARPNAGTPRRAGKGWVYPHTPEKMAARLPELLEAGACMVGGCCGTTPEHIAAFRPVVDRWNKRRAT